MGIVRPMRDPQARMNQHRARVAQSKARVQAMGALIMGPGGTVGKSNSDVMNQLQAYMQCHYEKQALSHKLIGRFGASIAVIGAVTSPAYGLIGPVSWLASWFACAALTLILLNERCNRAKKELDAIYMLGGFSD